ncbi:MAG: methyltransferase type 11 [Rickettsiales bacterium]|jgi:SAM-dependent methyltransferase|nr:methyltransferase type 11 [Rickettsiales bacterium]
MFWPDIIELKQFYRSSLGQTVSRELCRQIKMLWPDVSREYILGLGYATPYIRCFRNAKEAGNTVIAAMPAQMGVIHWPQDKPNLSLLTNEGEIPLADASVHRIIIAHALEFSDQAENMLRETWRVLAPGGRLIVIVPHRMGLWARMENTPFGHGHPFNGAQIHKLMRKTLFLPSQQRAALYFPPTTSRMVLKTVPMWEKFGERFLKVMGGVLVIEAEKQLYALKGETVRDVHGKRHYIPIARPLTT